MSTPSSSTPSSSIPSNQSSGHGSECGCRSHSTQGPSDYQSAMNWAQRNCQSTNPPSSEPQGVNWFWIIVILLILALGAWWWWINYGRYYQSASTKTETTNKIALENQALTKQVAAA